MANEEHLTILREGVEVWNEWRDKANDVRPDLSNANLSRANLSGANFSFTNLSLAYVRCANFSRAYLSHAYLSGANLSGANFSGAHLGVANLSHANLSGANLSGAFLSGADLSAADLRAADFTDSVFGWTTLVRVNLRAAKGLEAAKHEGPSTIGIDTVFESNGEIPEEFLRGAGVPDTFITFMRSLALKPFEFYSCFISYSSRDKTFAERLHADLQAKGVPCWFAPKDLKIGAKTRLSIDEAIRVHEKLLLVVSAKSIRSSWVEKEVEMAFEREAREKKIVLFPIRIDRAVMKTDEAWAADIRRTRNIGDFSKWKDHDAYKKTFDRLLRDLQAASKGTNSGP